MVESCVQSRRVREQSVQSQLDDEVSISSGMSLDALVAGLPEVDTATLAEEDPCLPIHQSFYEWKKLC